MTINGVRLNCCSNQTCPPTNKDWDAVKKLNESLMSQTGSGIIDLVWGPELEIIEVKENNGQQNI